MSDTITVELRRSFAEEAAEVLAQEVENSEEYHSTEQIMDELSKSIQRAL